MAPFIPHGFIPVLTRRFPLDELLRPHVEALCPAALYSVPELLTGAAPLARLPLLIDSGGYAALSPGDRVQEVDGLGQLVLGSTEAITPQLVHDLQSKHASTGFTLDFPVPGHADDTELVLRRRLSHVNALWALAQPRSFTLYASVQPFTDPEPYLLAGADGVALGGLAGFSGNREPLTQEVERLRCLIPPGFPLHVFGIGHPESVRAVLAAGATSTDSSACQRLAADGRSWAGEHIEGASPPERLRLALSNLITVRHATVPLALHPLWR